MPQVSLDDMISALASEPTLASFPTDTVPALATHPEQSHLIYTAKQRPPEKPIIIMGASFQDLRPYIKGNTQALKAWESQTQQHWPGQLTLVLPASDDAPKGLNPLNTGTLGIRVPNHPIALELLTQTGPLATTSANLSGQPPLTTAADIAHTFPTALTLKPKCYSATHSSGQPSTVAQWTSTGWKILRQGKIHLKPT